MPHIGETAEDLPETLFETAPTVLFTVPRYLQKMAAQVLVQAGSTSALKRFAYDRAMAFARGARQAPLDGHGDGGFRVSTHAVWRALVFRPILNKIGFDKLELVVSGGAPLPAETMAVWHMLGVNVCEMYGQTETAGGIIAGQRGPFPRPGDVGTVPEGFEVKLADDGEILVRSPDLFEGYWNNPEASLAVLGHDRLDAHRRCRRMARGQSAPDRSGARFPGHVRRQDHLAVLHRECAAGEPLPRRGGRVRARPQVSHRADRDRFRDGGRLGARATTWPTPASPAWRSIRACAA